MKSSTTAIIANVLQTAALGAASVYLYEKDCKLTATIFGAAAAMNMLSLGQNVKTTDADAVVKTMQELDINNIVNV